MDSNASFHLFAPRYRDHKLRKKIVDKLLKKLASLTVHYLRCIRNVPAFTYPYLHPHWSAGYSVSIFSLAGWKIIFWIPVFLLFNITRSGNDRSLGNLNKLANWLKSSSFRLPRQQAHLQEFTLIQLRSILRSAQWVTVYRLCIKK